MQARPTRASLAVRVAPLLGLARPIYGRALRVKPRPILYVDDSAVARAAAARLLGARGLAATILGSLREAAGIDPATVSGALLDLELGDGFGTELAERLRGDAPSLPIAFLTAGATDGEVERARRIGPIFEKPSGLSDAVSWLVDAESAALL